MMNNKTNFALEGGPLITIISATLNCAELLHKTLASIQNQSHKNIQWIIADGGSIDGTVDLIKQTDAVSDWFSSSDQGIYDAWNKAIPMIRGDWVLFLGAGDVFESALTLENSVKLLRDVPHDIGLVYGNVVQKIGDKELYRYGYVNLSDWECYRPKLPAHQGVFHRRTLFRNLVFDSSYRVVADSKFMFEVLKYSSDFYLGIDICIMEPGGLSSHPKFALRVMKEFLRLEREMGYKIPIIKKLEYVIRVCLKTIKYRATSFLA